MFFLFCFADILWHHLPQHLPLNDAGVAAAAAMRMVGRVRSHAEALSSRASGDQWLRGVCVPWPARPERRRQLLDHVRDAPVVVHLQLAQVLQSIHTLLREHPSVSAGRCCCAVHARMCEFNFLKGNQIRSVCKRREQRLVKRARTGSPSVA